MFVFTYIVYFLYQKRFNAQGIPKIVFAHFYRGKILKSLRNLTHVMLAFNHCLFINMKSFLNKTLMDNKNVGNDKK